MLNPSFSTSRNSSPSGDRIFVYEVSGLRQTSQSDRQGYPIRNSGNILLKVPYNRMNEEMLRISRMGGKIVSIRPLETAASEAHTTTTDEE